MLEARFHWGYRCIYAFIDNCIILRLAPTEWTFHGKAVAQLVAVMCDPIAPKLMLANADGCDGIAPYALRGFPQRQLKMPRNDALHRNVFVKRFPT